MATNSIRLPRRLPILIIDGVLFPGSSITIPVTSYRNMNMVRSHLLNRSTLSSAIIGVVPKEITTNTSIASSSEDEDNCMHSIGCAGIVVQVTGTNWPRPSYTLLVTGLCRFRLEAVVVESPYLIGLVQQLDKLPADDDLNEENTELSELMEQFREQASRLIEMLDLSVPAVVKLKRLLNSLPVHSLPDVCAAIVRASHEERLQILDSVDLAERFRKTLPLLIRQIEGLQLLQKAKKDGTLATQTLQMDKLADIGRHNRVDFEDEDLDDADDIASIERKIKSAEMPEPARKVSLKELSRLKKMPTHMPEHAMTRNYLELMTDLPWNKTSPELLDLKKSRQDLDADHYGLDKLKQRVLEYLAVRQLKNSLKGPILCFVGPPGVGKTSISRSIAKSLGREFHMISLGGASLDIRGHRRTYIGSMPGRIIQGLKTVGVKNPVFLLDEIDKMASGIHGDPAAALLEVLDPEQNCAFTDHYLNVPFDLSQVLFIATANTTASIPAALLDRMEVLSIPGYTHEEKLHIGRHHLVPKQLKEHGLSSKTLKITDEALVALIGKYTWEAGVRNLERKIGAVCRAVAVKVVESNRFHNNSNENNETISLNTNTNDMEIIDDIISPSELPVIVDELALEDILGPPMYENEVAARLCVPGVAVGLACTTYGGKILFVEANKMYGDGQLIFTGQLGDVTKVSANLALNWVRTHINDYAIDSRGSDIMERIDVHIHFSAVGTNGPSAGVTIVTALVSLFTGKVVASDVAMTGEITLRGLVLPVGGVKSKVLAAHRAGIRRIILPKRNEKDLKEIPNTIQSEMYFHFVSFIDEVIEAAFDGHLTLLDSHSKIERLESKLSNRPLFFESNKRKIFSLI